jgi:hypothetical protein
MRAVGRPAVLMELNIFVEPPVGMYMARSNSPPLGVLATGITGKAGPPGSTEVEM